MVPSQVLFIPDEEGDNVIILENFSECQILWRMCSIVFLAFTLKLSIQTLLSVVPTHTPFQ